MADSVGKRRRFPFCPDGDRHAGPFRLVAGSKTSSSPCHHFSRQAALRSCIDSWGCLESCWLSFAFYMFMNTATLLLVLMEAVCCSTIIPHRVINSIPVSLHPSGTFIFLPDYTHAEFELHRLYLSLSLTRNDRPSAAVRSRCCGGGSDRWADGWEGRGWVCGFLKVRPWAVFINTDTCCFSAAWVVCHHQHRCGQSERSCGLRLLGSHMHRAGEWLTHGPRGSRSCCFVAGDKLWSDPPSLYRAR